MANISNLTRNKMISGTSSSDSIYNSGNKVTINSAAGNDTIDNIGGNVVILAGSGNDSIYSFDSGDDSTWFGKFDGGDGKDTIRGDYTAATLLGGKGNDLIKVDLSYGNYYEDSIPVIDGGDGDDTIINEDYGIFGSISGGEGNDIIRVGNNYGITTIAGGTGNDTIYGYIRDDYGLFYQYSSGDGNDVIHNISANDTLQIIGDSYSTAKSGNDLLVKVGTGTITLKKAASKKPKIIGESLSGGSSSGSSGGGTSIGQYINNSISNKVLTTAAGNDTIINDGEYVTINSGAGNDTIANAKTKFSWYCNIKSGDGNDYILNGNGYYNSVYTTVDAGNGNDTIINDDGSDSSINGGAGNDSIVNKDESENYYVTFTGGLGNDTIDLAGKKATNSVASTYKLIVNYANGDGNDVVKNFTEDSMINITSGKVSNISNNGNDIILKIGTGSITLKNVKDTPINIKNADKSLMVYDGQNTIKAIYNNKSNQNIKGTSKGDYIYKDDPDPGMVKYSTINGGAGNDTIINHDSIMTINGGDGNDIIQTYWDALINGGKGNDLIISNRYGYCRDSTFVGGLGNDTLMLNEEEDLTILYAAGDGNDLIFNYGLGDTLHVTSGTISDSLVSGDDVTFYVGSGSFTLKDIVGSVVELKIGNGEVSTIKIDNSLHYVRLTNNDSSPYRVADNVGTVSGAEERTKAIKIIGNKQDNVLIGGTKADTLTGGAGADTFVYTKGYGNDVITDYSATDGDIIQLGKDTTVTGFSFNNNDLILSIGSSKLTIQGGASQSVTVVDENDGEAIYKKHSRNSTFNAFEERWFDEDNNFNCDDLTSIINDNHNDIAVDYKFNEEKTFKQELNFVSNAANKK